MQTRESALKNWLNQVVTEKHYQLKPLAGDASFRRYFRLHTETQDFIVMDAPPEKESLLAFMQVTELLSAAGLRAPKIHAHNETEGFLLLEDFGDRLFLRACQEGEADILYPMAIDLLAAMQQLPVETAALPHFDIAHMQQEMGLFEPWFLNRHLELELSTEQQQILQQSLRWIAAKISEQRQVFIHRDYHSRNLMLINDSSGKAALGVLDYQDAMIGPYGYDLVSLLKDCYIQWPEAQRMLWLEQYYAALPEATRPSLAECIQAYELCGIQRHLKVLGIFCRLNYRDGKAQYLADLGLTFDYVLQALKKQPELAMLLQMLEQDIYPLFLEKNKLCTLP